MSQEKFEEIIKKLIELRRNKNHDYGDSFMKTYKKYGNKAIFFDLLRKFERLENLLLNDADIQVSDETLDDTLGDIAVMCVNAMVFLDEI